MEEEFKGWPPKERRYDYGRTIYCFENNRSYAHLQSKSERLGVELYSYIVYLLSIFTHTHTHLIIVGFFLFVNHRNINLYAKRDMWEEPNV